MQLNDSEKTWPSLLILILYQVRVLSSRKELNCSKGPVTNSKTSNGVSILVIYFQTVRYKKSADAFFGFWNKDFDVVPLSRAPFLL